MASIEKLDNGKVRVYVEVNGKRRTKVLPARKAKSWARRIEEELSKQRPGIDESRTYEDVFKRYAKEVSPKKEGCRWEKVRLAKFCRDSELASLKLVESQREDLEEWIARRLKSVKPSTVNRELNLISSCLTKARRWRWMEHNPFKDLERPKNPKPRDRRVLDEEIEMLCIASGYSQGATPVLKRHFAIVAFEFAIETAMRASEICGLDNDSINFKSSVAELTKTKNGDERDVPLTPRAMELLRLLPKVEEGVPLFQLTPTKLDVHFRKVKKMTPIEDLHFHDSRHEAITRLANVPGMTALRLARISGHRDINFLLTYFNEKAEDMVKVLNVSKKSLDTSSTEELFEQLVKVVLAQTANAGKDVALG